MAHRVHADGSSTAIAAAEAGVVLSQEWSSLGH